jgi:hypothetical protein
MSKHSSSIVELKFKSLVGILAKGTWAFHSVSWSLPIKVAGRPQEML